MYGVDLDPQAVEVAHLSLYLKMLEEETTVSTREFQLEFHETLLPSLQGNIVCGNSVIETDILSSDLFGSDADEEVRLSPMNFADKFLESMRSGGFDAIVGNPPYLFITELDERQKEYFSSHYETPQYRFDIYGIFIEVAIKELLKQNGYLSFIIPHTLLSNDSYERLRKFLIAQSYLELILDIGPEMFIGASNETMIFVARKGSYSGRKTHVMRTLAKSFPSTTHSFEIEQTEWLKNPGAAITLSGEPLSIIALMAKVTQKLGDFCTINQGLRTGDNQKYIAMERRGNKWKKVVGGKDIARYGPLSAASYVNYEPDLLDAPRSRSIFESSKKVIVQEIRNITLKRRIVATYDNEQFYCLQSTNVVNLKPGRKTSLKFLLGILNSQAVNFFFGSSHLQVGHSVVRPSMNALADAAIQAFPAA